MTKRTPHGSRATNVLLPFVLFTLPFFAVLALPLLLLAQGYSAPVSQIEAQRAQKALASVVPEPVVTGPEEITVETVLPEDVLLQEQRKGPPGSRNWLDKSPDTQPVQASSGTSAGAIPAVKPFNFGRDPGGPADKTLYLTVPKLELADVPVFDSISEEKLAEGTIHVPATGFPWQGGANVYIAGHRLGYPNTRSLNVFYDLDKLAAGDDIFLKDAAGGEYVYEVTEQQVVPPDNVEVMNAVEGKSMISLQTCTLPDFADRIVVQGELVEKSA